jgi:hybrid cluster-associated redox disulfide protein
MTHETLSNMLVGDVMERWPSTADVFHAHAMACIGCALAMFCTVRDAAVSYDMPPEQLLSELTAAISATVR